MKVLTVIGYIILVSGFDSFFYGQHEYHNNLKWWFNPQWRYRILQKVVEVIGLAGVYFLAGLWCVAGCLMAHYFMLMDFLYYLWNRAAYQIFLFEQNKDNVFWLKRIYFSGYWLFPNSPTDFGFKVWKFNLSALAGFILAILSIFV